MANDSFDFNITKFLAEQKQLLALERERFAAEKIKILEPESVGGSPGGKVVSGEQQVLSQGGKVLKNSLNSQLILGDNRQHGKETESATDKGGRSPEEGNKENQSSNADKGSTVAKECPVERMLREIEGDSVKTVHTKEVASGAKDLRGGTEAVNTPTKLRDEAESSPMQQDEMEKWVSDTFYSYFPSFNKSENDKKSMLSRARQAEYQEYLKNIPQVTTKHQQYMEKYGEHAVQTVTDQGTNTAAENSPAPPATTKSYLSPGVQANSPSQIPTIRKTMASDADTGSYVRKGSPREKHMQDLVHTDLSAILNTDSVDRRNRMLAEEESRRKLEYQKELIKQIEEKRKEVERLREKEKLEEEMLTSRLEQQLKTMQLEEELEREKMRSEKIRIANEQNHIRRLQLLSKLENDHKVFNPYDDQRKTLSENGKEVYRDPAQQKPEKEKVYRYFSNSAQNEKPSSFASPSLSSEMDYDSSSESMGYDRYQYCKNCRADIDRSFLPKNERHQHHHHRHHHHHHDTPTAKAPQKNGNDLCVSCHKRIDQLCANCNRVMKRSSKRTLCTICYQALENSRLQKAAQTELKRQRAKLLRSMERLDDEDLERPAPPESPPPNPYKIIDIQYHESENDHDLAVLNPVIVRNNYKKPYSLNIDKDSLFHPSNKTPDPKVSVNIRNGEVFVDNKLNGTPKLHQPAKARDEDTDDLTDEMDDRISKYVEHYNTLWMKRGTRKNNLISQKNANLMMASTKENSPSAMLGGKLGPLPTLSPPKVYVSDRADNLKSEAMKTTEKKWDIPAVQRTMVTPRSPRVLTQLGAIRKQLQLEQLKLDQTYRHHQQDND
ncbi:uncharacterized protein LOC5578537 isoform X2 [Aedes aegypti]|uniref:Uncharacterized protein n=1 Tax=Aedes aegypti TaxID=7159 RepID=A0A1S4G0E3_AEDAE|nr:uncharacterized protein LOC5578537 isoform X2 [Aedes aegypti]